MLLTQDAAHLSATDRFSIRFLPVSDPSREIIEDARRGLLQRPRWLPPKYFYDAAGSALFDRICDTPEYYPTRVEHNLLREYADEIIADAAPELIVELGSGTARKTRRLFDACQRNSHRPVYMPVDVSGEMLCQMGRDLVTTYPWIQVQALSAEYADGLDAIPETQGPRLFAFLGGSIGNFTEKEGVAFLSEVRQRMEDQDCLLLGVDRVKEPAVLHAAYNDAQGITAQFNLNLLHVLNRELDADFDLPGFQHHACYRPDLQQIEMYLVSVRDQLVTIGALDDALEFPAGEPIRTEISRKFTPETLTVLLNDAGFELQRHIQPENGYFSLLLARPA